jgi:hypothetical protein
VAGFVTYKTSAAVSLEDFPVPGKGKKRKEKKRRPSG